MFLSRVPSAETFTIDNVLKLLGKDFSVEAKNVKQQEDGSCVEKMDLEQFCDYYKLVFGLVLVF